jgi:hypothetical protein
MRQWQKIFENHWQLKSQDKQGKKIEQWQTR